MINNFLNKEPVPNSCVRSFSDFVFYVLIFDKVRPKAGPVPLTIVWPFCLRLSTVEHIVSPRLYFLLRLPETLPQAKYNLFS